MLPPRDELLRKGWHMAGGLVATPLVLYTNLDYATVVALAATFFVVAMELLAATAGIRLPFWTHQLERVRRPGERFSWASIGFLLTLVALAWACPLPVALAAAGMLAFGDGLSAIVGRSVGRHRIPWNRRKTWEGSAAGFAGGLAGAWLLVAWYAAETQHSYDAATLFAVLVAGSAAAMTAESLPRLQDNVTVPLFAGVAMLLAWTALRLEPARGALLDRIALGPLPGMG